MALQIKKATALSDLFLISVILPSILIIMHTREKINIEYTKMEHMKRLITKTVNGQISLGHNSSAR